MRYTATPSTSSYQIGYSSASRRSRVVPQGERSSTTWQPSSGQTAVTLSRSWSPAKSAGLRV